jgi:NAD(P)-dependent dehydrogenase (short-subunit alcohol dehydrogenase family)
MGDHDNKIALVTGGAQGIGKGIVDVLSSEGAQVCIADISEEHGIKAVNEIEKLGRKAIYVQANFENSEEPKKVIEECVSRLGNISILVNNVGIQPSTSYKNIEETSEEVWDAIINVNLKSYFLMSKYSIPYMRKNGHGSIVNIASVQGLQSQKLVPPYAASKGAVLSLTRQISLDYIKENIRINAICPGTINTPMVTNSISGNINESLKLFGKDIPMGRVGEPKEIGQVASFLCSDKASFISGEYIIVDGGIMAKGGWDTKLQGE